MSITKSVEQVKQTIFGEPNNESQSKLSMTDGELAYAEVPIELFRYFDLDTGKAGDKELQRLKEVYQSLGGDGGLGEKLQKLRGVERSLGVRHFSESRLNRLWNYYKVSNKIQDLEKQRESMKGSIYV